MFNDSYGGKPGNRDTLPENVQDEIMVREILNKKRVQKHEVRSQHENSVNHELETAMRDQTQKNKAFFGDLFE